MKVSAAQSCPTLCNPRTAASLLCPWNPRQGYWRGLPFPSPGDLPNPGIKPRSPTLQADALPFEPPWKPPFGKAMSLLFNMLYRFVIVFLPGSKGLLISQLLSLSTVILEPKQMKSVTPHCFIIYLLCIDGTGSVLLQITFFCSAFGSLVAQMIKRLTAMQETWV